MSENKLDLNKSLFYKRENRKVVPLNLNKKERIKVKNKIKNILKEKKKLYPSKIFKKDRQSFIISSRWKYFKSRIITLRP